MSPGFPHARFRLLWCSSSCVPPQKTLAENADTQQTVSVSRGVKCEEKVTPITLGHTNVAILGIRGWSVYVG